MYRVVSLSGFVFDCDEEEDAVELADDRWHDVGDETSVFDLDTGELVYHAP